MREKKPWTFSDARARHPDVPFTVTRCVLSTGDYSARGLEKTCAIERKGVKDFINTLQQNQYRFYAELGRMNAMRFAAIVVESHLDRFAPGSKTLYDIIRISGDENHFMQKMMTIKIGFPNIQWFFAANRQQAEYYTWRMIHLHAMRQMQNAE